MPHVHHVSMNSHYYFGCSITVGTPHNYPNVTLAIQNAVLAALPGVSLTMEAVTEPSARYHATEATIPESHPLAKNGVIEENGFRSTGPDCLIQIANEAIAKILCAIDMDAEKARERFGVLFDDISKFSAIEITQNPTEKGTEWTILISDHGESFRSTQTVPLMACDALQRAFEYRAATNSVPLTWIYVKH